MFIAEAYWDMEWTLQQQGFDYCYDKRLYDRLVHEGADAVRGHLSGDAAYQERLLRFIENHDEPRAAATFASGPGARRGGRGLDAARARGSSTTASSTGTASTSRSSSTAAPPSRPTTTCARSTTGCCAPSPSPDLRSGDWRLCECTGWPDNDSHRQLVAWCWATPEARHLVVVNLADAPAQARVHLPWDDLAGHDWALADRLGGQRFERAGDALAGEGLYVALDGWGTHFLAFAAQPSVPPLD